MSYKLAILALVALHACNISALPSCVCSRDLKYVCGSDGVTYGNACLLDCRKSEARSDLTVASPGPCQATAPSCTCTFDYKPVCGTDGTTYPNRCALLCTRSTNPNINVVSEGPCQPACICTDELDYTCGSDGTTYDNPCLLNCETAKNPSLSIKYKGTCADRVKVAEPALPACFCTYESDPVCGSNGITYSNPCQLNCATAQDSTLRVQHSGECRRINIVNPGDQSQSCTCPRDMKPVCGSDGVTYNNLCLLECAGAQVSLAKHAPC